MPPLTMVTENAGGESWTGPSPGTSRGTQLWLFPVLTSRVVQGAVDLLLIAAAYVGAWLVRMYVPLPLTQDLLPEERWGAVDHYWWLLLGGQLFFLYIFGLYDDLRGFRYREVVGHVWLAGAAHVLLMTTFFYFSNSVFPRTVLLIFGAFEVTLLSAWRLILKKLLARRKIRVVVIGPSRAAAAEFAGELARNPWMGLEVVGLIVGEPVEAGEREGNFPLLGSLREAPELIRRLGVEDVLLVSGPSWRDTVLDTLSGARVSGALRVAMYPTVWDMAIGRLRHLTLHDTPLIEVRRIPNEPLARLAKRGFDVTFAALGLLLAAPLMLLVAAAVKVSSPGPIFYLQERVGQGGRIFRLIKFRTMIPNAEKENEERLAEPNDPRITPVGAWLRRFRIDELPQLLNVLKGDMSFVGPRPERPGFVARFAAEVPGYLERHQVKPGLTGLAQVRGYYDTAPEKKLKYDLAYIYNYSFTLDLLILVETLKVILTRRGS
ncbi:MAG: sugar transferase [Acidobacteriota bacterium]